jgi:hypothetical protein
MPSFCLIFSYTVIIITVSNCVTREMIYIWLNFMWFIREALDGVPPRERWERELKERKKKINNICNLRIIALPGRGCVCVFCYFSWRWLRWFQMESFWRDVCFLLVVVWLSGSALLLHCFLVVQAHRLISVKLLEQWLLCLVYRPSNHSIPKAIVKFVLLAFVPYGSKYTQRSSSSIGNNSPEISFFFLSLRI